MKEDILEQIVAEYLEHEGYFIMSNIKFKPDSSDPDFKLNQDSNHSDIDILGYNPLLHGHEKIMAVSCKSYQVGFRPLREIRAIETLQKISGREAWKRYRELVLDKWARAFIRVIKERTGENAFTYVTAVTKLAKGEEVTPWENYEPFQKRLNNNPIKILTLSDMVESICGALTTTTANSDIGRLLQLLIAAGVLP